MALDGRLSVVLNILVFSTFLLQISSPLACTVFLVELIHQTVIFLFKQADFSFISSYQSFLLMISYSVS